VFPFPALPMGRKKSPVSRTFRARKRNSSVGETASLRNERLAGRIQGILASKSLSLYRASARSRSDHPNEPAYHIPSNLFFRLRSEDWTPTIYQLSSLSLLSGYHLVDWLGAFEFFPDEISGLQAALRRPRTTLLDSATYDSRAVVSWFSERQPERPIPPVTPLSQLLEQTDPRPVSTLVPSDSAEYVYLKIGTQDALAFPELLPGSIVRANPRLLPPLADGVNEISPHPIFLIEHKNGLCCSNLHYRKTNRITLLPTKLPFASVEFQLGSEARLLGVVDLEFRILVDPESTHPRPCSVPEVPPDLARLWTPGRFDRNSADDGLSDLLRSARVRAGLSFHEASRMSRLVASKLGDERYFTSLASLSDYEARNTLPRHIHKLFTLCAVYAIPFYGLLRASGLLLKATETKPIPDEWMQGVASPAGPPQRQIVPPTRGILDHLLKRFGASPFFLRGALPSLLGLTDLSLHDVFWVGGQRPVLHPSLSGALLVVVNRRRQTPPAFLKKSPWERPLYVLVRRSGSYILASCTLEGHTIVVHPQTGSFVRPERLENHVDADVLGQIIGVVRTLLPPI
jgi:hypothetical protein